MSVTAMKMPLAEAEQRAASFIARYLGGVGGVHVVGSVRRQKPEVGDIEILYPRSANHRLNADLYFDCKPPDGAVWLHAGQPGVDHADPDRTSGLLSAVGHGVARSRSLA